MFEKKKLIIKHRHLVFPNPSYGLDLSACSWSGQVRLMYMFSDLKAYLNLSQTAYLSIEELLIAERYGCVYLKLLLK